MSKRVARLRIKNRDVNVFVLDAPQETYKGVRPYYTEMRRGPILM